MMAMKKQQLSTQAPISNSHGIDRTLDERRVHNDTLLRVLTLRDPGGEG